MHEVSIVEALLEAVRQEVRVHPDGKVQAIHVRIGSLRQIVPDMLRFCFEAATRDSDLAGARLDLEEIYAEAHCRHCQRDFPVTENWFECPHCKTTGGELLAGRELDLIGIELVEAHT